MSCPSYPGCAQAPTELPSIVGTAPREEAYCVVELPKPWPAKVKKVEGLIQELRDALKARKGEEAKLLATPEIPWASEFEGPRALLFRWDGKQTLCLQLPANPKSVEEAMRQAPQGEPTPLYLVCTHGSRDPCCGLLGVPVYRKLAEISEREVLQVSHLGGHRFAPVLVAFPEWRFFGHLSLEQLESLDRDLTQNRPHLQGYRGQGRLKAEMQVVEAALWEQHGETLNTVTKIEGDKEHLLVEALVSGQPVLYEAELGVFKYEGYKSCKDFRKNKCSTLKLPYLKSLKLKP